MSCSGANFSRISLATLYVSVSMTSSRIFFLFLSSSLSLPSSRRTLRWYHHVRTRRTTRNLEDREPSIKMALYKFGGVFLH